MTRNEAREVIGLNPIDGGDDVYINASLFPLGSESTPELDVPDEEEDVKDYEEMPEAQYLLDEQKQDETKETNFPNAGDDKKITLRNSEYPQFDYDFAKNVKEQGVGKQIWAAGGNIRGNEAFMLWGRARDGSESPAVLKWIKEREAWAARHSVNDGNQFVGGSKEPNLSNVAGVVALMKWGVINPKLGQQGMKDVILELTKKLEGRKEFEDFEFELDDKFVSVMDNTNPSSVRPRVAGPDQWAFARVNSFLAALRTGRFQGGRHDTDLFPKGHPLSSKT